MALLRCSSVRVHKMGGSDRSHPTHRMQVSAAKRKQVVCKTEPWGCLGLLPLSCAHIWPVTRFCLQGQLKSTTDSVQLQKCLVVSLHCFILRLLICFLSDFLSNPFFLQPCSQVITDCLSRGQVWHDSLAYQKPIIVLLLPVKTE